MDKKRVRVTKKKIPMVPLKNLTIMPGMIIHFDVNVKWAILAVEKAMLKDQKVFLIALKPGSASSDEISTGDLCPVGTIATIKQLVKLPNGLIRVLVEGELRAKLYDIEEKEDHKLAVVKACRDDSDDFNLKQGRIDTDLIDDAKAAEQAERMSELTAMVRMLRDELNVYLRYNPGVAKNLEKHFSEAKNISELLDMIAINLPMTQADRQNILEAVAIKDRFAMLSAIMTREVQVFEVRKDLQEKVRERVEKNQREYVLREQLRFIKKELGDDSSISDADRFREEAQKLKAPDEVREKILKEIERFCQIPDNSSESNVSRMYIETLLEMPWDKSSRDNKNLDRAEKILETDHYGLKKVKERMLEFLAVRTLTNKGDSPIICLVGPPGTGKTSVAKSVARALNKKFIRISLGGVRDEAEIRGHRRTYVGAMPGRIASGLLNAGVKNPLMLLDEIDKMSSDYRGDTASALLEVLDSEQNQRFRDHYIELPIDLSQVLFIATANSLSDIPRPLLDRMEIIEVSSYTENEKFHIAREHLIPKQLKKHGLKASWLNINDKALEKIIHNYTREAGVRSLERRIGQICRKSARMILQEGKKRVSVNPKNLNDFLGIEKYQFDKAGEKDEVGIVRGLAWTSVGGDTLQIEVNVMPGKGEIIMTGQLGDVMKESARAGISYIRSISKREKIAANYFEKHDIHIHIPEGAVPKDGPSAGITMATAIYSAITGKKVRCDVAMTGEITLRGRVLPIGGLKEKTLAAKMAGIKTVLVPKENERDIGEIDEDILKGLSIIYVENMDEVLREAIA